MKYILTACVMLTIIGCTNQPNKPTEKSAPGPKEEKVEIVRQAIPFSGDFSQITNMGSINIVYTPGPCKIEVEGSKHLVGMTNVTVDSGVLMLSMSNERNQDVQVYQGKRNITAYISCPELRIIAVCGSGDFRAEGKIHTDDMHIGSLSSGTITIDSIECSNLKFEVNATGESTVSYLNVENEFTLISSGHGKFVSDNVNVGGELIMDDIVGSTLSCKGRTSTLTINNSGDGLCEFIGAYKTKEIYQSEKAQVVVRES